MAVFISKSVLVIQVVQRHNAWVQIERKLHRTHALNRPEFR